MAMLLIFVAAFFSADRLTESISRARKDSESHIDIIVQFKIVCAYHSMLLAHAAGHSPAYREFSFLLLVLWAQYAHNTYYEFT